MQTTPSERIKTVSNALFRDERQYLTSHAMRVRITLDAPIERQRMQTALDAALDACPYIGFSRETDEQGMWYVPNQAPMRVLREMPKRLGGDETCGHLSCLVCHDRKLDIAICHILTDGMGILWFVDALLGAYYGNARPTYEGAGSADFAHDLMCEELEVPVGFEPAPVMPQQHFSFANKGELDVPKAHLVSFAKRDLRTFCRAHDCSNTAALAFLLSMAVQRAYPKNRDPVCVRCPVNTRNMLGAPHTFVNASIPQVLACVQAQQAQAGCVDEATRAIMGQIAEQATRNRMAAFTNVVAAALAGRRSEAMHAVFDTFAAPIVFSDLGTLTPDSAAEHVRSMQVTGYAETPLMANLVTVQDRCHLALIQTFADDRYINALAAVMAEQGIPVSGVPDASPKQAKAVKNAFFLHSSLPPELEGLPRFMDRMARVVRNYGERTAFVDGERSVTYAQLDEESGKVYRWLRRHGIGTEDLVLVVMPRSAGFFSCVGGVLRAGAAFVPMEDTYSAERIAYIRKDAQVACVLNQALYEQILFEEDYLSGYEATSVHDACFAVYTSGSTGNPKGVLHEYGSLDVRALAAPKKDHYPESPRGMMEHFYFAATIVFESTNLLNAATIHIIDRETVGNVRLLARYVEEHRLESVFMPPSYIRAYRDPSPTLKEIIAAGEPANMLHYPGGVPQIHNMYGLTESANIVLDMVLDRAYDVAPVGTCHIPGLDLHLENDDGNRVEGPGEGEVCYRNTFFRGYINLPEKTTEAIRDGYFHTGDLARRDERGLYYIRGRKDDMFKINGNRIEPAEIERRVREATGLTQVVAKGFHVGERAFICVYFLRREAKDLHVLAHDGSLACDLSYLRDHLPDYMIPAHYVALDEFPTNVNGKLARIALEPPDFFAARDAYVAPEGELERLVCDAMAEALGLERVGATEDFYRMGGDSMAAVQLLAALADDGYDASLANLYAARTPRALAAVLEEAEATQEDPAAVARKAMAHPQPVLGIMLPRVRQFVESPDSLAFNVPQLLRLKSGTDLDRLRAAVDKVFLAHPALLSTFGKTDGQWYITYDASLFEPTRVISLTDDEFQATMSSLVAPHKGIGATPHRRALYHTDSADYLFWDIHHAIVDGTSLALLRDQVYSCYEDPDYQIPADLIYYRLQKLAHETGTGRSAWYDEAERYYERHFEVEGDVGSFSRVLKPDLAGPGANLNTIVGRHEHTRAADGGSTLFLAATLMAVARLNDERSALAHAVYNGRNSALEQQMVGLLATTVPVCLDLNRSSSPKEILAKVREQLDFGMSHCLYPYAQLNPTPVANTVQFNFQKGTMGIGSIAAIVDKRVRMPLGQDGTVNSGLIDNPTSTALTWYCGYDTGWYSQSRMGAFHQAFNDAVRTLREAGNL